MFHRFLSSTSQHTRRARSDHRRTYRKIRARRALFEPLETRIVLDAAWSAAHDFASPVWFEHLAPRSAAYPTNTISGVSGPSANLSTIIDLPGWIVRLTPAATQSASTVAGVERLLESSRLGVQVLTGLGLPGQVLIEIRHSSRAVIAAELAHNPYVASFEQVGSLAAQATPNDVVYGQQLGLNNTGQQGGTADADIDAPEA